MQGSPTSYPTKTREAGATGGCKRAGLNDLGSSALLAAAVMQLHLRAKRKNSTAPHLLCTAFDIQHPGVCTVVCETRNAWLCANVLAELALSHARCTPGI